MLSAEWLVLSCLPSGLSAHQPSICMESWKLTRFWRLCRDFALRSQRERGVAGDLVGTVAGSLGHHWVAVTAELGSPLRSMKGRGEVRSWSSPRVSPVPGLLAGGGMLPWTHTQGSNLCPEQGFPVPSLSESRNRSFGTGRQMSAAHLVAAPTLPAVPEGLRSRT